MDTRRACDAAICQRRGWQPSADFGRHPADTSSVGHLSGAADAIPYGGFAGGVPRYCSDIDRCRVLENAAATELVFTWIFSLRCRRFLPIPQRRLLALPSDL